MSESKKLMDVPCERSGHVNITPTLGGIGVFIVFSLSLILFAIIAQPDQTRMTTILALLGGIIVLLFLGIKDDLLVLSPGKKVLGQLLAAAVIVFFTDIRIYNFESLLGLGELSYMFSTSFTIFIFIFIINAFNLTDGIDGLAGSIATLASLVFGIYFLVNQNYLMTAVSFVLIAALLGFLRFNLSKTQKIFMGDSGSMFIGFILAFQGVALIKMSNLGEVVYSVNNVPVLVLSVLAFPILDTTRVFFIRLRNRKSPFSADRNHIHHRLLDLGLSHKTATFAISNVNLFIIISTLFIDSLEFNINVQFLILLIVAPVFYLFPFMIKLKKGRVKLILPKIMSHS
ncbi:undecaprenyl/decaprenyl-phosphate alpha-N-acetylglucosaminyl 1-phosphate transferase [Aquimarina sp. ERC-38]|uniref:MraY family glycosyltransferase n=1 Tax=Aquimarina sp. ERC-38 TaxID=2949996 RepID=UPI002246E11B|nr:MraY family glycosyltransferase [Aquimarina sp. ERC-38]UZO81466.1 undecaprenyl/decaprenyl-phosphate alpha-N-acetylglucosaminyl 1-phosphate transferase [Aquimarina sp. ERC-38]